MANLEGKPPLSIQNRIRNATLRLQRDRRISRLNREVRTHAKPKAENRPIILFNASTRLGGFSQNAAFSLLTSWGLRLSDHPVLHFTCNSGMSRCVLGTNPDDHTEPPPCEACVSQSKRLFRLADVHWFCYRSIPELTGSLSGISVEDLMQFTWKFDGENVPIGQLVLPALRWVLRRHHLQDDEATRFTFREYIQSACSIILAFDQMLKSVTPEVVVVFNGIMFPEAALRWLAIKRGIRVITHEVGFQPFSTFFSKGQATAYPMDITDTFDLSEEQNDRLDQYLSQRFKGEFTMAGIRFWPKISGLSAGIQEKMNDFKQVVPVFTNVVNDTSQVHASTVFSHMYEWLDHVLEVIQEHPETFFVIRAHPDEKRLGTRKHSRQPVSDWIVEKRVDQLPNVVFIDSNESLSSYDLIKRSKFVIVYNSSIGLEAALLKVPVLCGGEARYTQYPTVFFPQTPYEYQKKARDFLSSEFIDIPPEFNRNARRVLYWQLYRSSIPLEKYLHAHPTPGYVQITKNSWKDLLLENSISMKVLVEGIVDGTPFIMPN